MDQKFMAAANRSDAAGLATLYAEDEQLLPPNSDFFSGRQAIQETWQGVIDMGIKGATLELLEAEGLDDTAYSVEKYSLQGKEGHGEMISKRALGREVGSAIVLLLLTGCAVAVPTPTATPALPTETAARSPVPSDTPDISSTIVAMGPFIEVTFYGERCEVRLPPEIRTGDQGFVFHNLSGGGGSMHVGRNHPGRTWQDVLGDIGTPYVDTPVALGVAVLPFSHFQMVDSDTSYRRVELELEGDYHVVVEARNAIWACGPFHVVQAP